MRQLLSAGRNSDSICQRQPIIARQHTCCNNPIGGPDLGLSLSALRKEHRLQHIQWEKSGGRVYSGGAGNLARALFAPTNYGHNAGYADGDYATRARIWKEQQDFVRGMTHFLRTDPSVPAKQKEIALSAGLEKGAFDDTRGYPHQLYVREARRMVSDYVVTQKDLEGRTSPADSVGLASYGVDEWPYATVALDGQVALMGGYYSMLYLEERNRGIYRIPYRAIRPKQGQCANLLVPVCVSASHIAMTSLRMEPVWMILGESAGVAAAMADWSCRFGSATLPTTSTKPSSSCSV